MNNPLDLLKDNLRDNHGIFLADKSLQSIVDISAKVTEMQEHEDRRIGNHEAYYCVDCESLTGFDCICEDE